jgi:hypothetical protein
MRTAAQILHSTLPSPDSCLHWVAQSLHYVGVTLLPKDLNVELLLNLIWITLALGALCAFARSRRWSSQISQSGWRKALLALTCCMVLLFPIISASDDLHPVQAAVEDASKRVQLVLGAGSTVRTATPVAAILFAVFATYLLFAFSASWCRRPRATRVRLLDGERFPVPGRGPPSVL